MYFLRPDLIILFQPVSRDVQLFGSIRIIGAELCFPVAYILFGDTIYSNIMTPYTAAQLARKGWNETENITIRHIRYYSIGVDHAFAELKQ